MNICPRLRSLFGRLYRPPKDRSSEILIFGDSHTDALVRAIKARGDSPATSAITAWRLRKEKNGKQIGDMSLEEFLKRTKWLQPRDIIFSMVGGNQHAILSTIQHEVAFDFCSEGMEPASATVHMIPNRAIKEYLSAGVYGRDGQMLRAMRNATRARIVHIVPPPPKKDAEHILRHQETHFSEGNIAQLGVSDALLRKKAWDLQATILKELCRELEIEILMPPEESQCPEGFLAKEFYARDITHANAQYGELVLQQVEKFVAQAS